VKSKIKQKINFAFFFLYIFFLLSCGENNLREDAIEFFDKNVSLPRSQDQNISGITRSSDGLQFTKLDSQKNQAETIGLTQEGKVSFEGEMKDGKPHGDWTTFFEDGRPRWKGVKKEGVSHGPFIMWYPNGKRKIEGNYLEGKKHGLSTMWHLNGAKWKEQTHQYGKASGTWRTWDNNGELQETIDHVSAVEK
jgi:antitoxin component YwqK of YwqJK toxin-antitoxin module